MCVCVCVVGVRGKRVGTWRRGYVGEECALGGVPWGFVGGHVGGGGCGSCVCVRGGVHGGREGGGGFGTFGGGGHWAGHMGMCMGGVRGYIVG